MSCVLSDAATDVALTLDTLFGGTLCVTQPAKGHRAGTDAVLLAASAPETTGLTIDVGAGVGTVGMVVAQRNPQANVILLERDPILSALARRNVEANRLTERIAVAETSILAALPRRNAGVKNESAALVLTNPPFYVAGEGRKSPEVLKRDAHVIDGTLADWISACLTLLQPGGRFCVIHRPDALPDLLSSMRGRLGAVTLRAVYPRDHTIASRVLLSGIKGSKAPFVVMPGLVLHDGDGRFTPWAAAVHDGRNTRLPEC